MAAGIGAAGILGVAKEVTPGTWVTPAKFIPIRSESLAYAQETIFTRPIRGVADIVHAVPGNATVEGDIEFEVTHDNLPWFLYAMRGTVAETGTAPPYVYTLTPTHIGQKSGAGSTLSITVVRNGITFGYTQCVVGKLELTVDNGILVATVGILAKEEATQTGPTATWPTDAPFGAGQYVIEIPTATQVYDVDGFSFSVDDSPEHQYRLRDDGLGAMFTKFGERTTELTFDRDFDSRTDYDAFKALTAQEIHFRAEDPSEANNYIDILVHSAIKDSYEIGLDGQGDLVRASITYQGIYSDSDSAAYTLECGSATEDAT
jgi:hypothetical protein